MKVEFWYSGNETARPLQAAIEPYEKRLGQYIPFRKQLISLPKGQSGEQRAYKEQERVLKALKPTDHLILLDENGKSYSSRSLAAHLEGLFQLSQQRLIFLASSSHGFHSALKARANELIALSQLTFNHEHARLIFIEQLYRCLTLMHNDPYHH